MTLARNIRAERDTRPRDWARMSFAVSIGLYGAILGAVAVLINILSATPFYKDAEYLSLGPSLFLGIAGAMAGGLLTAPFAYRIFGEIPLLDPTKIRKPRNILIWGGLGIGYGLLYPMLMGAFFLPLTLTMRLLLNNILGPVDVLNEMIEIMMSSLLRAVTIGGPMLFTGVIAGMFFGIGGWVIDQVNSSYDQMTSRYGTWGITIALSAIIITLSFSISPETLRNLG